MNLRINGTTRDVEENMVVRDLIESITGKKDPHGVAVAINGSVVARSNWNEKNLCADDDIEILGAVSGG